MRNVQRVNQNASRPILDSKQLAVVNAKNKRLIVEAPAGFGKTSTMISMISYWVESGMLPHYKKILCLSFSVSAATRMKDSITEHFAEQFTQKSPMHQIIVTNFHGFCRMVLRKYGHLIGIQNIEKTDTVDINSVKISMNGNRKTIDLMLDLESDIKSGKLSVKGLMSRSSTYVSGIMSLFIPRNQITYDGIIIMVLHLFQQFPTIRSDYQHIFYSLCVDEFQDTNILGWSLIQILLCDSSRFIAFGDQMQQIYRFQGALPNLIDQLIEKEYSYIRLETNYRFASNPDMLAMDSALRKYKDAPGHYSAELRIPIQLIFGNTVSDEGTEIISNIHKIQKDNPKATFAILVGSRSFSTNKLIRIFQNEFDTMDATFNTEDEEFVAFQSECLTLFESTFQKLPLIRQRIASFLSKVEESILPGSNIESYMKLLKGLLMYTVEKVSVHSRREHVVSVLEAGALRRSLSEVDSEITVSTIHGAKGLEWDYVFIANFEQLEFPAYPEMQKLNIKPWSEKIQVTNDNEEAVKEILNKLYVAFSRAKQQVYFAYAGERFNKTGKSNKANLSVLASLPFLKKTFV